MLATLGVVAAVCVVQGCRGPEKRRNVDLVEGAGVALLLRVTPDGLELERVAGTARPANGEPPRLVRRQWMRFPNEDELIVTVHDEHGQPLDAFGHRLRGVGFNDQLVRGKLTGRLTSTDEVVRLLRVPYLRGAAFLHVTQATTSLGRPIADAADPDTVSCSFEDKIADTPVYYRVRHFGTLLLEDVPENTEVVLPQSVPDCDASIRAGSELEVRDEGWNVASVNSVSGHRQGPTDPAWAFNVVVVSEGFRDVGAELADFVAGADQAFADLMSRRPFSLFDGKVAYYRVFGASTDSGVDHCPSDFQDCYGHPCPSCTPCCIDPAADPHDTLLEVYGISENLASCSNFATDDETLIYDAVSAYIDPALVDLFIVLVNCPIDGGKAHESQPIVYLGLFDGPERAGMVVHEAAHVLAAVGEEYVSGALAYEPGISGACQSGCLPLISYPNVGTRAQLIAGMLPWTDLARPGELNPDGTFPRPENRFESAAACYPDHVGGPGTGDANEWQALGARCGAQWVHHTCPPTGSVPTSALPCCANGFPDYQFDQNPCFALDDAASGLDFFRPSAFCTMHDLREPFCRVCSCALWGVLAAATATPESARPLACSPAPDVIDQWVDIVVDDEDGNPLAGVAVQLIGPDAVRMCVTDAEGRCRLPLLPPGTYRLVASKEGFVTYQQDDYAFVPGLPVHIVLVPTG